MAAAGMETRGTGREIPALIALIVWGGGFELAPALHAMEHATLGAHRHGATAQHPGADHGSAGHGAAEHGAAEHGSAEHGAGEHGGAEHGGVGHRHSAPEAPEAPDPEHGDGDLAHRGLAAHASPVAVPPLDPAAPTRLAAPERGERAPARAPRVAPHARGPPGR